MVAGHDAEEEEEEEECRRHHSCCSHIYHADAAAAAAALHCRHFPSLSSGPGNIARQGEAVKACQVEVHHQHPGYCLP